MDKIISINKLTPHLVLLLGLCTLTVYAQFFSLLYRVSLLANVILLILCIFLVFILKCDICTTIKIWKDAYFPYRFCFILFLALLMAARTSTVIYDGDTYLYHLQAIRWITDYGVVPGLGNLNTRFAFNSSFLCLQALFTFEFLPGIGPLSGVNGFVVLMILSYAVCEMKFWRSPRFYTSDFARLAIVMVLCKKAESFSSPGTDIFAGGLVLYLFAEWIDTLEESSSSTALFSVFSILAVFSVTLKLSSAMVMLLAFMPAVKLLKKKRWKAVFGYLLAGSLVLLPFLIRNVIISGWLLYPFDKIDFFTFDWKIPAETVKAEMARTLLSARAVYNVLPLDSPFSIWFPHWIEVNGKMILIYITADIIAAIVSTVILVQRGLRQHRWEMLHVCMTVIACIVYIALSAPSIRFGKSFVFLLPLITAGLILEKVSIKSFSTGIVILMTAVFTLYFSYIYTVDPITSDYLIRPAGYANWRGIPHDFYGQVVYIPETTMSSNNIGWDYFPSAIYESTLEMIELRGDSFHEGFRVKEGIKYLF